MSNILLSKCRGEWSSLPADAQAGLKAQLTHAARAAAVDDWARGTKQLTMPTQRLCMVLAAAAAEGGAEDAVKAATEALGGVAGGGAAAALALETVVALAEEADRLDKARRPAVCQALRQATDGVVQLVSGAVAGGGEAARRACALLAAWCRLDPNEGELSLLSAAQLGARAPQLLQALLGALSAAEPLAVASATDALVELYKPGAGAALGAPPPGAEEAAFAAAAAAIVAQRGRATAANAEEDITHSMCRLAVVLAETDPETCASGQHGAVAIAEMLVECLLARRDAFAAEAAAEFFCMLNTVPKQVRHATLQEKAFEALLGATLWQCAYPLGFKSWDEDPGEAADDEDEDAFTRFREQVMADLFGNLCSVLGAEHFLGLVAKCFEEGEATGVWQKVEVALYVARAAANVLKQCALSARTSDAGQPGVAAERAAVNSFLANCIFARLHPPAPALASNAAVITQVTRVVGEYAQWLGQGTAVGATQEMCVGSLQYVMEAIKLPTARRDAALAFQKVCARCTPVLATDELVGPLATGGLQAVASAAPVEERVPVIEGLARVIAALPHADVATAAIALATQLAGRVSHFARAVPADPTGVARAADSLSEELQLMAAALRFLEKRVSAPASLPHPAMAALEAAWPALSEVAGSADCRRLPNVCGGLCDVFKRAIGSAGAAVFPVLVPMLEHAVGAFESCQAVASLEVLQASVEAFGADSTAIAGLAAPLGRALSSVLPLRTTSHPEVVGAVFDLAHRSLLFAPGALFASGAIEPLLDGAAVAARLRERDPARCAFAFLALAAGGANALARGHALEAQWAPHAEAARASVAQRSPVLVTSLLAAISETAPRHLVRNAGGALHTLATAAATQGRGAQFAAELQAALTRGAPSCALSQEALAAATDKDLETFYKAAGARQPPLAKPRFEALCQDFASLLRREGSADALLAYLQF